MTRPALKKPKRHVHAWGYWVGIHGQQTTVEECLVCGIARSKVKNADVRPSEVGER